MTPPSIPLVDLRAQYFSIRKEIDEAIASVIGEASFIGGRRVEAFEHEFAAYVGMPYCVSCGNGTDAIEILLKALGVGVGDEVIVPAHSWISTSEAVTSVGAKPVFVDTDRAHYTIVAENLEKAVTPRTKAIIPVHLYGLPAPIKKIMEIARKHRLLVLEDCAQAHGATHDGSKVGTFGDAASFSFYPGKNLGAYGDAGAMVTRDEAVADRARMIANHGQRQKHDHQIEGRNSRLDGMQAAVLSVKLRHLDSWNAARRQNANTYRELLEGSGVQVPHEPDGVTHVYHLFVVQVSSRDKVRAFLKTRGIETGIHYPVPLPFLPAYAGGRYRRADFPVVSEYTPRLLSLPMYAELDRTMIERIADALKDATHSH